MVQNNCKYFDYECLVKWNQLIKVNSAKDEFPLVQTIKVNSAKDLYFL
jgi:hypothetical protein